jgi:hypothetical protein
VRRRDESPLVPSRRWRLSLPISVVLALSLFGATLPCFLSGRIVRASMEAHYRELAGLLGSVFRLDGFESSGGVYESSVSSRVTPLPDGNRPGFGLVVENAVQYGWCSTRIRSRFKQQDWRRVVPGLTPDSQVSAARIPPLIGWP